MKSPMWKLIIAALLVFMAYNNVRTLMTVPLSQWAAEQWLLLVVTLGLVAAAVLSVVRYRAEAKQQAEAKEQEALEMQKAEEEKRKEEESAWLAEANVDGESLAEGETKMQDAEGTVMERELEALDSFDDLQGYELLDVSAVPQTEPEEKTEE